ncbi:MAG: citrate synthase family protein [Caldilineaceae bacterium]|nr:citrate synthase family protein [Caldilineaceae bacterium]
MELPTRYLSAREAADRLGISVATLYAYVSRGLLRSEAVDDGSRARRYYAEDVEALRSRKEMRRDPESGAQNALSYGMPVLESAITLIEDGCLFYRGYDALGLAQQRSVEEVASLIWLDHLDPGDLFAQGGDAQAPAPQLEALDAVQHPIECYQATLARAATGDLAAYLTTPEAMAATGARILHRLVAATTRQPVATSIAQALQGACAPGQPASVELFSAALILCADHELNVSAFTARCVASAGSTPYAVVIAGLAALQGHRHGGHTERVGHLLREANDGIAGAVASYLRQGASIPGFGHRLYPDGDPRARLLLEMVNARYANAAIPALANELRRTVHALTGAQPTVDFALEVMARTLELPPHAALALFALGRTIGWIGHAIEQAATEQLIRPRARYVGAQGRTL